MFCGASGCNLARDATGVRQSARLLPRPARLLFVLAICISGCSRSGATSSEAPKASVTHPLFFDTGEPSRCSAQCLPMAVAIAREELALDPKTLGALRGEAMFTILDRQSRDVGSAITRVKVADAILQVREGPARPVVLLHKSGHLCVLFGAIRVNGKLLYQMIHGGEAVSLVTKQALLEAGFEEAWRFEKKAGAGVPIHVGSAVLDMDRLWHNFGEVFPDKPLEAKFRLKNVGNKTVVLGKALVSCQCTVPNLGERTTLAPGEALGITVATKPTGSTSLRNLVTLTFYEKGSGASRSVQLSLIGNQRESMEVTPTTVDFGLLVPGRRCRRLISLREKPTDRFLLKTIDPGKLPITHNVEVARDKDGLRTYRVTLDLSLNEGWSGECRGALQVATDSYIRPTITVPVRFEVEPPVRAIPSVISFGTLPVGESRQETVEFVSRYGDPVEVRIEDHPDECSLTLELNNGRPKMIVEARLKGCGVWQGTIRAIAIVRAQEHVIAIRCAGYGRD